MNVGVRLTEYGLAVHRDLATPRHPLTGIVGAIVWRFDGTSILLIWFSRRDGLAAEVARGAKLKTQAPPDVRADQAHARRVHGIRPPGGTPMIGIVACSKSKLAKPAPARELYTSHLFRLSLEYAEQHCDAVYIASAMHGLVELEHVIEPYDSTVQHMSPLQRAKWAHRIAGQLRERHAGDIICALAGSAYIEPIKAAYYELDRDVVILDVLRGMQIGERLAFLTAQVVGARRKAS
jgi:hypothetical protein